METVRYAKLVAACGQPKIHLLWLAPEKDVVLQQAIQSERVLLIHQATVGTKQDFGTVGFDEGFKGQIFIFPKSLQAFAGKRVISIQYDGLDDSGKTTEKRPKPKKAQKLTKPKVNFIPPPKLIPFVAEKPELGADSLELIRSDIRKAMEALEDGHEVAAYKILQKIVES